MYNTILNLFFFIFNRTELEAEELLADELENAKNAKDYSDTSPSEQPAIAFRKKKQLKVRSEKQKRW